MENRFKDALNMQELQTQSGIFATEHYEVIREALHQAHEQRWGKTKGENGLLPCPFCGCRKIDQWHTTDAGKQYHTIRCLHCHEGLDGHPTKTSCRDRWNSRYYPQKAPTAQEGGGDE